MQELRQNHPEIQGRMVVQDRQQTIDSMASKPEGIEIMVHDIFTEQPVKGIYHRFASAELKIVSYNRDPRCPSISLEANTARLERRQV